MTNSSPEPPPSNSRIGLDELIAIVVAFGTIGAIFFWVLGSQNRGFQLSPLSSIFLDQGLDDDSGIDDDRPSITLFEGDRTVVPRLEGLTPPSRIPASERFAFDSDAAEGTALIAPFILSDRPEEFEQRDRVARIIPPMIDPPTEIEEDTTPTEIIPTPPVEQAETVAPPTEEIETPEGFYSDVSEGYWAYPFIFALTEREIYTYDQAEPLFNPDQPETRATFAAQIERAFAQEATSPLEPSDFKDIQKGTQEAQKIDEAVNTGFLKGYPGQVFRPDQLVPRVQVLVALATGLDLEIPTNTDEILQVYQDADQIPDWARDKVAAATQAGLVVDPSNTNTLDPQANATRAEVAAMIYQGLVEAGRAEPIDSEYVVE